MKAMPLPAPAPAACPDRSRSSTCGKHAAVTATQRDSFADVLRTLDRAILQSKATARDRLKTVAKQSSPQPAAAEATAAAAGQATPPPPPPSQPPTPPPAPPAPSHQAAAEAAVEAMLGRHEAALSRTAVEAQAREKRYRSAAARLWKGNDLAKENKWEKGCALDLDGFRVLGSLGHTCAAVLGDARDARDVLRMEYQRCVHPTGAAAPLRADVLTALYAITGSTLRAAVASLTSSLNSLIGCASLAAPVDAWRQLTTLMWQELGVPLDACGSSVDAEEADARVQGFRAAGLQQATAARSPTAAPALYLGPAPSSLKRCLSMAPPPLPPSPPPPPPPTSPGGAEEAAAAAAAAQASRRPCQKACAARAGRERQARQQRRRRASVLAEPRDRRKEALLAQWRQSGLNIPRCAFVAAAPGGGGGCGGGVTPDTLSLNPRIQAVGSFEAVVTPVPQPPSSPSSPPAQTSKPAAPEAPQEGADAVSPNPPTPSASSPPAPSTEQPTATTAAVAAASGGGKAAAQVIGACASGASLPERVAHLRRKRALVYRAFTVREKEAFILFARTELGLHVECAVCTMRAVAARVSLRRLEAAGRSRGGEWAERAQEEAQRRERRCVLRRAELLKQRWRNLEKVRFLDLGRFACVKEPPAEASRG